jgi:phosphoribosylamine--glycine ligase
MGRDVALLERLAAEGHQINVIGEFENPNLADLVTVTGGEIATVDKLTNRTAVADFVARIRPDMFLTHFDSALAEGVVDEVRERSPDVLVPCPDKEASKIEWDKFFLRELIDEIDPSYNPEGFRITEAEDIPAAIEYFRERGIDVVIKPRNLTGGKGVKVMGKHLDSYEDAAEYARKVLADEKAKEEETGKEAGVEIQEKLEGHEFTMQLFTDGDTLVEAPLTYDYPYRDDGDVGPGTGGMGAFSQADGLMPFVSREEYNQCIDLMDKLLQKMKDRGLNYKGMVYPAFFKTKDGRILIVETNARGGDPELINVVDLLEPDVQVGEFLTDIARGELDPTKVRYRKAASALIYFCAPEYCRPGGGPKREFHMDMGAFRAQGVQVRFAAATRVEGETDRYLTNGPSRIVGLSALGATPWEARAKIIRAIDPGTRLEYRQDVANQTYIASLH